MEAKRTHGLRVRSEPFGGIVYLPSKDDFFAIDKTAFSFIEKFSSVFEEVKDNEVSSVRTLAEIGVLETNLPVVPLRAYSFPSFIGKFKEIPSVSKPMVVNCFATAFCPLKCVYCHADDLMISFRDQESDSDIDLVSDTASKLDAMVAVITGGDPLTRPDRARRLIPKLAETKALVLDTSGVDDIESIMDLLVQFKVHVRLSLDLIDEGNDKVRPGNRAHGYALDASRKNVERTLLLCQKANVPITIQTVISSFNDSRYQWEPMRTWLIDRGVKNWVFHMMIMGGKARRVQEIRERKKIKRGGIFPTYSVREDLWGFIADTINRDLPIEIRCTDTDVSPTSVLLIGSKGDLYTEGSAHRGKAILYNVGDTIESLNTEMALNVDWRGHAQRYLNWNKWQFPGRSLEDLGIKL